MERTAPNAPPARASQPSLRLVDRVREWRNRLIANPKTQTLAKRLPFTRPIARRKATEAFDLVAGFVYSQVLFACVELELLARLSRGAASIDALAQETGLSPDAMTRLCDAARAVGLLETRGGGDAVGLGEVGAVIAANPGIVAMIRHHRLLYDDLADPVALLRGDRGPDGVSRIQRFWAYATAQTPAETDARTAGDYSDLMAVSQGMIASETLDAYAFDRHSRILDIGGGSGAFAIAVAKRVAGPRLTVFDLPNVVTRTAEAVEREGLSDRIDAQGGDFFRDPLPSGADLITLVRVCYDHDDAKVADLLAKARTALAPGGRLLIAEPMSGVRGAERVGDAYFGFYLLAMASGRSRTPETFKRLLAEAGFLSAKLIGTHMPVQTSVIVAK